MSAPVYTIEEQTVVLPVRIREASSVYATFLVPAGAVKNLLPAGLTPLQTIPGRATCTIVGVDYREGDLGQYHEVGVCFLLRPKGGSRLDVVSMVRNQAPAYIHRLPVTTSFSCEAGRQIWGFPKDVMNIDFADSSSTRTVTLRDGERLVLQLSVPRGGNKKFDGVDIEAMGSWGGPVQVTPAQMAGDGVKAGFRAGQLVLGDHPIATELRALGLPKKPLLAGSIERFTGSFGEARSL
ncbi:MAG: acetoacetate decarboxylase family protein [Acidimicrobiia bacterium]|nr:acetoacetate decarboxylase family protein [Acidimicrobiia bacterium]